MIIRTATESDLDQIMRVEESWPQTERAPRDKFISRLRIYPQGFLVAEKSGRLCSTFTSCPLEYDPQNPHAFENWDQVTNSGLLYDIDEAESYNALYIVSGVVDQDYRGGDIFDQMIHALVAVAKQENLDFVTAGAVIPRYHKYCLKHGRIPAEEFVFLKRGDRLVDPFLEIYRRLDFHVPDKHHVLKDYYPDEASEHYAALVVHQVESS